jgi:hypothetical protein
MTEQEAKDFIEQSLKYGREFIDVNSGYSYSFEMENGYVSVKRNDGYVINASFNELKKYPVKFDWDKNITSVINVVGIDHNNDWQGWKIYVRCADLSPIQLKRREYQKLRDIKIKAIFEENKEELNRLEKKKVEASHVLYEDELKFNDIMFEYETKFSEEDRKRNKHFIEEWVQYIDGLKYAICEYYDFVEKLIAKVDEEMKNNCNFS